MNTFVIISFCLFIISIDAQFNITHQIPNNTALPTTHEFIIQISGTVKQPQSQSFIYFNNASTNTSISQIDVSLNTSNATYSNDTLTFHMPDSVQFNINDEFYITFDSGVLFSNGTFNSSAELNRDFWYLKVIASSSNASPDTTTSVTSTVTSASTGTLYSDTTGSSMTYNNTSTLTMTTYGSTYTSMTQSTATATVPDTTIGGGQSATRSAQLGMGLGITFITVMIIGEIIYFKYCYSGSGRSGSYFT